MPFFKRHIRSLDRYLWNKLYERIARLEREVELLKRA